MKILIKISKDMPIDVTEHLKSLQYFKPNNIPIWEYRCEHIDLDSESNGSRYLNDIASDGNWELQFIFQNVHRSAAHPLCIFRRVKR